MRHYGGPATVRTAAGTAEIPVTVRLAWTGPSGPDHRAGRLSGEVFPSPDPKLPAPPLGPVVLGLPDGYRACGELAVVTSAEDGRRWLAFTTRAPCFPAAEHGIDRHWIVEVGHALDWLPQKYRPEEVAERVIARHGLTPHRNAGEWGWFCADLNDAQRHALCGEIDVCYLEQVVEGHPAPCFEVPPPDGIQGAYIVTVRRGIDPVSVAARLGVVAARVFTGISAFFVENAGRADLDRIRRDPDVVQIEQDVVVHSY